MVLQTLQLKTCLFSFYSLQSDTSLPRKMRYIRSKNEYTNTVTVN